MPQNIWNELTASKPFSPQPCSLDQSASHRPSQAKYSNSLQSYSKMSRCHQLPGAEDM